MKEQVKQLVEATSRPNVVLQVIPVSPGAHQGMSGNFVIAEFTDRQPAIYQDTALRGQIIEDAAPRAVAVRDSKDPEGPKLAFTPGRWQEFTRAVKTGAAHR